MDRSWATPAANLLMTRIEAIAELSHRLYGNQPDPANPQEIERKENPMRDLCNTDKPLFCCADEIDLQCLPEHLMARAACPSLP